MIDHLEKTKCNGCYACYNICPMDAITMEQDTEGFYYPMIDYHQCIRCEKCSLVCPIENPVTKDNRENPKVFAAWSLDEEVRYKSTSGGVFTELAISVLNMDGYVCGAVYKEEHSVEHYITCNTDELEHLRQSKYVQSSIHMIYRKIGQLLESDKPVLFCGTPCECAGLYQYLLICHINQERLILIDFVCRGSNSPKVYQMFLKQLEIEYSSKIKRVWFKNKTHGWNRFSTRIEFENGENYLKDRNSDLYIRGYIEANLYMRPSCSNCAFKSFPRISEITLGDFWGIKLSDKSKNTDRGTSLVIINSDQGEELWEKIKNKLFIERKDLKDAIDCNPSIYKSIIHDPKRDQFMKDLDRMNIKDNISRFLN